MSEGSNKAAAILKTVIDLDEMEAEASRMMGHLKYLAAVGVVLTVEAFDEDWQPVGPMIRSGLLRARLAEESGGTIHLTQYGRFYVEAL